MNKKEFLNFWNSEYPEALPIGHELKCIYPNRWFRIHSLPCSKRYAANDEEYQIIYDRQNKLINDLIGEETEIIISFSLFSNYVDNKYEELIDLKEYEKADTIELHAVKPQDYGEDIYLDIFIKSEIWESNKINCLLRRIADDEVRALFICSSKKCIISPYDGGVDIIVESEQLRDDLKVKYKDWLPKLSNKLGGCCEKKY